MCAICGAFFLSLIAVYLLAMKRGGTNLRRSVFDVAPEGRATDQSRATAISAVSGASGSGSVEMGKSKNRTAGGSNERAYSRAL